MAFSYGSGSQRRTPDLGGEPLLTVALAAGPCCWVWSGKQESEAPPSRAERCGELGTDSQGQEQVLCRLQRALGVWVKILEEEVGQRSAPLLLESVDEAVGLQSPPRNHRALARAKKPILLFPNAGRVVSGTG